MRAYEKLVILFSLVQCFGSQKSENLRLNYFDIDLLRYAVEDQPGNVMLSPASIKSTLAMILEGARGETAEEIRSALRLSPKKEEYVEQLNMYLSVLKSNSTSVTLQNSNAVFVCDKLKLRAEYQMMLQKVYMSKVCKTNFRDPFLASDAINKWVNESTKGVIPSIVEPAYINPLTEILFTNVLYFKSSWKYSFNPRNTKPGCFRHHGACRNVSYMELTAELNYAFVDNLMAHAVELPYEGGQYSMILLVPHEISGLATLIRDLPYMSLPQISSLFDPTDVTLFLPKFTIDYSEDIVGTLKNMRIRKLFSSEANTSGIFENDSITQISSVVHKVHLAVDEAGTVAAAATAAMIVPLMRNGVFLRADHPFVFFLRDNRNGVVLFEGKVEQPTMFTEVAPSAPVVPVAVDNGNKTNVNSIKRSFG